MSNQRSTSFWAGIVLAIIAGAWTAFHIIWNIAGQTADDYWGTALLILFVLALILAFVQYVQERSTLQPTTSEGRFPEPAIAKFFLGSVGASELWFVLRMSVGAQWFLAGWEKVSEPTVWGTSGKAIAGFAAGALAKTSGPNPAVQGWYAWFLQHVVLPNAGFFSFVITWGEVAVGLGILLGVLTGIAAGFGVLMNLNYLLSGTVSVNPVLGMFGLFLVFAWRVCGWIGLDSVLLPAIGLPWKPGTWFRAPEPPRQAPQPPRTAVPSV